MKSHPISMHAWPLGWPVIRAQAPGGGLVVTPHGGQVLSWSHAGSERRFVSPESRFAADTAIRGGIPVIFPQFGTRGLSTRHGFARTRLWRLIEPLSPQGGSITLALQDDKVSFAIWPHHFQMLLVASVTEGCLTIGLSVTNTDEKEFSFTVALHTYLRVSNVEAVCLHGLRGCPYLDATQSCRPMVQAEEPLRFTSEIDRIYPDAPGTLTLEDAGQRLQIIRMASKTRSSGIPGPPLPDRWRTLERMVIFSTSASKLGAWKSRYFWLPPKRGKAGKS